MNYNRQCLDFVQFLLHDVLTRMRIRAAADVHPYEGLLASVGHILEEERFGAHKSLDGRLEVFRFALIEFPEIPQERVVDVIKVLLDLAQLFLGRIEFDDVRPRALLFAKFVHFSLEFF